MQQNHYQSLQTVLDKEILGFESSPRVWPAILHTGYSDWLVDILDWLALHWSEVFLTLLVLGSTFWKNATVRTSVSFIK